MIRKLGLHTVLIGLALSMLLPFYWMLVLSTQPGTALYQFPPPLLPGTALTDNWNAVLAAVPILTAFINSIIVSGASTFVTVLCSAMGGFAFAMYRFPGRKVLFSILLATMMVPFTAGIIPWFFMMSSFGWVNNFLGLIIPSAASAFGIFWMRQYAANNLPVSLLEAAKIDGMSEWRSFFKIGVPLLRPGMSALAIMSFVGNWNNFLTPLLLLRDASVQTLPLMLRYMSGDPVRGTDMGSLMLANTLAVLPLLLVFLSASQYFMSSLTAGAVKE